VPAAMEGAYHGHTSGWPRRGTPEAKAARGLSKQRGAATWDASWWRASIDWHGHRRGWGGGVVDPAGVEKNVAWSFFLGFPWVVCGQIYIFSNFLGVGNFPLRRRGGVPTYQPTITCRQLI
jgi:hypothetical protein